MNHPLRATDLGHQCPTLHRDADGGRRGQISPSASCGAWRSFAFASKELSATVANLCPVSNSLAIPLQDRRTGDVEDALERAWRRETSVDQGGWLEENPSRGQCAVTALVIQDLLGGSILRGEAGAESHYWNLLPSGREMDLTRQQFGPEVRITNVEFRDRDYLLSNDFTRARYGLLRSSVERMLRKSSD